ncbi:uncharacterized protein EAF01_006515 [Botrytis porri]|uniref:uncharacterized protein n=1 Tax=Botrytis porri TaxID=87229 RepID=UPI001901BCC2|nr:uncharacterized protein EAF01_006515 [Botrytis porri]KAF7903466.1 hypothetical protein EAF01_006515 [Botrytis porri]
MNLKDTEEWANNLPIPSNLSAITEPTDPAEISPHQKVKNKPQELGRDRLEADLEDVPSPSDNTYSRRFYAYGSGVVLGSSMGWEKHHSDFGDDGPLLEEVDGYVISPAYSPASPIYNSMEADSFPIQADTTLLSLTGEEAILFSQVQSGFGRGSLDVPSVQARHTATQANSPGLSKCLPQKLDLTNQEMQLRLLEDQNNRRLEMAKREQQNSHQQFLKTSHQANLESAPPKLNIPTNELACRDYQRQLVLIEKENKDRLALTEQKQQSSTQRPRRIQIQHQQLMAQLSPHRRLGVPDRVPGVDFERCHNIEACQSMETSANIPPGLCELVNEDLLPKPQPKEIQMRSQASQKAYKRYGQPSYPSISLCGKSEPRGPMEFPPYYTDGISGQVFKSPKSDELNDIFTFNFQNEIYNKGLGGFWHRGLMNVESLDAVIWRNLQRYLIRERVYTTLEAGSNSLVANLDWSATPYKERITLRRQMFPRAACSIQKILDVLAVTEEIIGLSIGAIAWACLLGAVENLLSLDPNWTVDPPVKIITEMSEIVSKIARYTVMENIYAQWKGMSLNKDYEHFLINLSTHILIYLGAFVPSLSENSTNADMKPYFDKIIDADTACRGFTVIVSAESTTIDRKRSFEEFSDDSGDTDDLDGAILRVDGDDEVNNMPSSAKRIRL